MAEQEKREKVIKGLKCCKEAIGITDPICGKCPYEEYVADCITVLTADAFELLKAQEPETSDAPKSDSNVGCWYDITHNYTLEQVVNALKDQEPRVMTLEEVIESEVGAVVWLEDIDKPTVIAGLVYRVFTGMMVVDFQCVARTVTAGFYDYGKRWRCWTSNPDEKTREAILWE